MLDDFMEMLADAEKKTGLKPSPEEKALLHAKLNLHKNKGAEEMAIKSEAMDNRVRAVYHQDFACFFDPLVP